MRFLVAAHSSSKFVLAAPHEVDFCRGSLLEKKIVLFELATILVPGLSSRPPGYMYTSQFFFACAYIYVINYAPSVLAPRGAVAIPSRHVPNHAGAAWAPGVATPLPYLIITWLTYSVRASLLLIIPYRGKL